MRIGILSDIHSNLHALNAVLQDADKRSLDLYLCLGDIVGYGAFPQECCDLIREKCKHTVFGNHEYAVLYPEETMSFNPDAKKAIDYTSDNLNDDTYEWFESLEPHLVLDGYSIAHGSLRNFDEYVSDATIARMSLEILQTDILFVGHTHYPEGYRFDLETKSVRSMDLIGEGEAILERGYRYLINVGSIGQPRDGDTRAAYGIYDTDNSKMEILRIKYSVKAAASAIIKAGLPEKISKRLYAGR